MSAWGVAVSADWVVARRLVRVRAGLTGVLAVLLAAVGLVAVLDAGGGVVAVRAPARAAGVSSLGSRGARFDVVRGRGGWSVSGGGLVTRFGVSGPVV